MNIGIVFIDKNKFDKVANQRILDKKVADYTIDHLINGGSDKVYVISHDEYKREDVTWLNSVNKLDNELKGIDGRVIITSIDYVNVNADTYSSLFASEKEALVVAEDHKTYNIFSFNADRLKDYEKLNYELYNIEDELLEVQDVKDVYNAFKKMQRNINYAHLENGVSFVDIENTYIGEDVKIEKGVVLYPNIYLEGKTYIKENTSISAGSHIINATIGKDCTILSSRITDSVLHDHISVGPCSHLRMNSEIMDGVRIGNFVEFKKTKFGKISRCAHLTYLGDSEVGEDVNIGCGVITANYDGNHKFKTIIKDKAFIGSNSNLIAPITIGKSVLVAAGSTITKDVEDGAMAIARQRQEIKPDFGFKYINKEKD